MTITLRPGSTVMFTGDSITDCEDGVHPTPAGHAALAAAWPRLVP
ncbi:hypothetical protein AB0L65_51825 [Nonomuraea sp. NPDC052116]